MRRSLTQRQQMTYALVKNFAIENDGNTPTMEWLRVRLGVKSINAVAQLLKNLEIKGYIFRRKHAKKNHIVLRDYDAREGFIEMMRVPVIGSVGCDDLSTYANEVTDESLEIDKRLFKSRSGPFVAVRAVGRSMDDAGIEDGDYVLVQVTEQAENGDKVLAIVGDHATVKELDRREGVTILRPVSKDPSYKPIVLHEDFQIQGKVVCTIPKESMDITELEYDHEQ